MFDELYNYGKRFSCKGGCWKIAAGVLFVAFGIATVAAFFYRNDSKKYRDKIIEMSKDIPNTPEQEAELEEIKQREETAENTETEE